MPEMLAVAIVTSWLRQRPYCVRLNDKASASASPRSRGHYAHKAFLSPTNASSGSLSPRSAEHRQKRTGSLNRGTMTEDRNPVEELLTVDDVCSLLKVKKSWLYDTVERGLVKPILLGKQLRFRPATVDRYLDDCEEQDQP
jgi:excisionase family DNA binding protein